MISLQFTRFRDNATKNSNEIKYNRFILMLLGTILKNNIYIFIMLDFE